MVIFVLFIYTLQYTHGGELLTLHQGIVYWYNVYLVRHID